MGPPEHDEVDGAVPPPLRQGYGRRETDGWVISPKMLGMVGALLTIIMAMFSPVFYVKDMAASQRETARSVERQEATIKVLAEAQAATKADLLVLTAQVAAGAAHRADLEQRLRTVEKQ